MTADLRPATVDAALAYLDRGWSVIPIRAGEKVPLVRWEKFQRRRPSPAEVRRWFERWPDANIGIVTGAASGLVVLDVDGRHGGTASLGRWEAAWGPLPPTVEAESGGGGRHLYWRHPGKTVPNRVGMAPGIDLRGDGGMVVAPPSVHPSGRRYAWRPGHAPDEVPLAALPPWLGDLVRQQGDDGGHPAAYWRALVRQGVEQGRRNMTIASFAGHLLWHGVDPKVAAELLLCWNRVRCRPPLPDDEVAGVVSSITRLHGFRRAGIEER